MKQRFLLDTQAFLWITGNEKKVSRKAKNAFLHPAHELFISIATPWEMAIKLGLGKLSLPVSLDQYLKQSIQTLGLQLLPVEIRHLVELLELPNYHRDPFDRLLIAQARVEKFHIIGSDEQFDRYEIVRVW